MANGFQVQEKMCSTCIYRPNLGWDLKTLEGQVADKFGGFRTFRACHAVRGRKVCCRGFWDQHKDKFQLGQLAQRLGFVRFVNRGGRIRENG